MLNSGFIELTNRNFDYTLSINVDGLIEYEVDYPVCLLGYEDKEAIQNILGYFDEYEITGICTWNALSLDCKKYFEQKAVSEVEKLLLFKAKLTAQTCIAHGQIVISSSQF